MPGDPLNNNANNNTNNNDNTNTTTTSSSSSSSSASLLPSSNQGKQMQRQAFNWQFLNTETQAHDPVAKWSKDQVFYYYYNYYKLL